MACDGLHDAMRHARIMTVAQWAAGCDWRLSLLHSNAQHALLWITRGQGIALIEGVRCGIGVHNALAIPAGTLFSLDLGKTGFGLVCLIPAGGPVLMPDEPQHLRIRDVTGQNELTALLEVMQREQSAARPFTDEALDAQAWLLSVWLRRAMIAHTAGGRLKASERLVKAYAALIERDFTSGRAMAAYARTLGVTPTHLTRVCKDVSGLTAAEMLTERSLHAARDMLEAGERPIGQIAASLGFGSAAYFSRFVLQHTGQSPSALRARAAGRANPAAALFPTKIE
ncbi:helix-turn-helix transcriptional regulator [Roseovarius azorensis]|nr:helix-turn-helix transcriptional regulator [Roseovarius azorensis]